MPASSCPAWEYDAEVPGGHRQCGRFFDPNFGSGCVEHPLGIGSEHDSLVEQVFHYSPEGILETA